jgi:hypothetical protein
MESWLEERTMKASRLNAACCQSVAIFLLAGAAHAIPANAAQLQVNTAAPYLCAVVQNGATANDTPVIAYSCAGDPQYQWNYVNGAFQGIGTAKGKSMCLDVKGQGTSPNTVVQLYSCTGNLNQQWEIDANGEIQGVQSGLCLDSSGGPPSGGGTQLIINTCSGAASQNWILRGMQFQLSSNSPYKCAAVSSGDTAPGTPAIFYSCADSPNDLWNYVGGQGQIQGLGTWNGTSTCLTAAAQKEGSLVTLSPCTGSTDQNWSIFAPAATGPNWVVLGGTSLLCLDSAGGPSTGGGTQLLVNNCSDTAGSQNWIIR